MILILTRWLRPGTPGGVATMFIPVFDNIVNILDNCKNRKESIANLTTPRKPKSAVETLGGHDYVLLKHLKSLLSLVKRLTVLRSRKSYRYSLSSKFLINCGKGNAGGLSVYTVIE